MSAESKISDEKAMEENLRKACTNNNLDEVKECIEELENSGNMDAKTKNKLVWNDILKFIFDFVETEYYVFDTSFRHYLLRQM